MKYKYTCNECNKVYYGSDEPIKCFKCSSDNFGIEEVED